MDPKEEKNTTETVLNDWSQFLTQATTEYDNKYVVMNNTMNKVMDSIMNNGS